MRKLYTYRGHEVVESIVDAKLAEAGYERVDEVRDAQIIITYFTNLTALENAYYEDGGILKEAAKDSLIIEMSAQTPMFARELFALVDASNMLFAEAPLMVIDGCADNALANKENVASFLAADEAATEAALPVLQAIAGAIHETTGIGSASLSRAAYTLQSVASLNAAVEADALYRAVRMMPAGMGEAAMGNAGAISPAADSLLRAIDDQRFSSQYTIEMMMGELAAALTTAEEAEVTLPQAESCLQLLEILAIIGGADNGPSVMAMAFREQEEVEKIGLDWQRAADMSETFAHTHEDEDDDDDYFDDFDDEIYDDLGSERLEHFEQEAATSQSVQDDAEEEIDYGFEDDDPGYDFDDRDYVELADQEDFIDD